MQLLRTIPGVGVRTAETLLAYIDEPRRFARPGQIAAYFGLVPCRDASAGFDRLGHITKQGPVTARKHLKAERIPSSDPAVAAGRESDGR